MSIRLVPLLAALVLATCGSAIKSSNAQAFTCDRVAAPNGADRNAGTADAPYRNVQRLADTLRPGQTGCLRAGTYDHMVDGGYVLKYFHGGRRGKPITIRSYPGERAQLQGVIYFPKQSPHVALRDVNIDGRARWLHTDTVTVQVNAFDVAFTGNDVTNRGLKSCMIMGSNDGYGPAVATTVSNNIFHGCGDPSHGILDHDIYVENARNGTISGNVFLGAPGYAVHLYPNALGMRVSGNVMSGNGGGVIFAGEGNLASSDNLVTHNVITGSTKDFNISQSWGGRVGTGNVARDNCVSDGRNGNVESTVGFKSIDNVAHLPDFVDAAAGDFRLAPDSPCLSVVGGPVATLATALLSKLRR